VKRIGRVRKWLDQRMTRARRGAAPWMMPGVFLGLLPPGGVETMGALDFGRDGVRPRVASRAGSPTGRTFRGGRGALRLRHFEAHEAAAGGADGDVVGDHHVQDGLGYEPVVKPLGGGNHRIKRGMDSAPAGA